MPGTERFFCYFWTHCGEVLRLAENDSPALLAAEDVFGPVGNEEELREIDAFIAANYRETDQGEYHYFIRNDRLEDLAPLLNSPELYVHMWPVSKGGNE